ncbi:SDR family NAD(P)-dependent oxidoreductase [Planctomycetaceae bacterium SH139]
MDLGLEGQVIVVTGGASGIGLATIRLLSEEKAIPVCFDLQAPPADSGCASWQVDITDLPSVSAAYESLASDFGTPVGLVHAAAIGSGKFGFPFSRLEPDDWRKVLEVNVMGMTNVAHVFGPALQTAGRGAIVFIASISGQIGSQTDPPYSASKAANINFAQCLAKDLAAASVRVNSVCPGMVQTPLNRSVWQAWHDSQAADQRLSYEEWAGAKIKAAVPLGRWQQPRDVANMIVFLLSDRCSEVTGQTINVDGGFVMHC